MGMGQTRGFSLRMNLSKARPVTDLASTGYCLANSGAEYLVYQPKGGESFTVKLPEGTYRVEWTDLTSGTKESGEIKSTGAPVPFRAPFPKEAVLYLKR